MLWLFFFCEKYDSIVMEQADKLQEEPTMKLWTIQRKSIAEYVQAKNIFVPDFGKSRYLKENPALTSLYSFVQKAFEKNNDHLPSIKGLVFTFLRSDGRSIQEIKSYEEFQAFMRNRKIVLRGFWNQLNQEEFVVMELEFKGYVNPLLIDLNDFQFLMPPIQYFPPYTEKSVDRICTDLEKGQIRQSEFPSYVIQAHIPYIAPGDLVNVYPLFEL